MMLVKNKKKKHFNFDDQFHGYPKGLGLQPSPKADLKYNTITDSEGLQRAYAQGDYHIHGKTMFIAGSHTLRDWYDDFIQIPVYGDIRNSERYQKVLDVFRNRGEIDTVVGHSLGGSVALEFQKNYPDRIKKSRTYGAPVFDLLGSESEDVDRYRNWLDPVSVLDRGAKKSIKWNILDSGSLTHDYSNIADSIKTTELVQDDDDYED